AQMNMTTAAGGGADNPYRQPVDFGGARDEPADRDHYDTNWRASDHPALASAALGTRPRQLLVDP
ncbi:MAG TPA: hypothetical protein VMU34_19525, partial [Mycobacterium sp.]|nr:hypothetical protein [Mycobacterium sp.]